MGRRIKQVRPVFLRQVYTREQFRVALIKLSNHEIKNFTPLYFHNGDTHMLMIPVKLPNRIVFTVPVSFADYLISLKRLYRRGLLLLKDICFLAELADSEDPDDRNMFISLCENGFLKEFLCKLEKI